MATNYEAKAQQARQDTRYALAKELGLSVHEVSVSADGLVAKISAQTLLQAARRLHAQYDAKTMGEIGEGGRV